MTDTDRILFKLTEIASRIDVTLFLLLARPNKKKAKEYSELGFRIMEELKASLKNGG